ncbi:phosphoribosyltransferase family protein, partial [Klebsiella pneumoniae]|uniref:phosphoribosyltransferase family protein n=1 Tax=Klebsiella pneumoniae TaxID=573 RepID=UPI0031347C4B
PTFSLIKCDKKRNMGDGQLSGFEVFTDSLENKTCIIVDDICSRGGTFMGIAKALKDKGAKDIYLIVSHWENVADEDALQDMGIVGVYKT